MTTRIFAWSKSLNFQFFPSTPGRSKFGAFAPIFNVATSGSSDTPATAVMERARSAAKTVLEIIVPPAENQFVVPPLGGSVECRRIPRRQTLPPKGGTTNCDFHSFRASQRDMPHSSENRFVVPASDANPFRDAQRFRLKAGLRTEAPMRNMSLPSQLLKRRQTTIRRFERRVLAAFLF